jgi:uncharacterized protein (TIGR00369 family)
MTQKYGVVSPDILKSYDGLGFLQAIIAGTAPNPPISGLLNFHLVEVENGRAVFEGIPEFRHYNPIGSVHGGFAATLLDSALGCAVHTTLPAGVGYSTLELSVNLVRGITPATGAVLAEGRIVHAGRRTATAEAKLYAEDGGALLAHATTTCLILR